MSMDQLNYYLDIYSYWIIFFFLFCGIVGIPAPEESLLVLVGILSNQHDLQLMPTLVSAFAGSFSGMLFAYLIGRSFMIYVMKYGRFIGLTDKRWAKLKKNYMTNIPKTILFGFYIPGLRQINPYFAGLKPVPFATFLLFSFIGTGLWVFPFVLIGYYAGNTFHIKPEWVPYLGVVLLSLFLIRILFKRFFKKVKRQNE